MAFNPRDDESIKAAIKNSDIVINMIGKHYETKHLVPTRREDGNLSRINYCFNEVHIDIPRKIAKLSKECGVKNLIHVSSLAADIDSKSKWSKSKALGEIAVRDEFPGAIIVKPSTAFGPEDRFLNWIADACERFPFFPLINEGKTLVQPVYSHDVAKALMKIVYVRLLLSPYYHHHSLIIIVIINRIIRFTKEKHFNWQVQLNILIKR